VPLALVSLLGVTHQSALMNSPVFKEGESLLQALNHRFQGQTRFRLQKYGVTPLQPKLWWISDYTSSNATPAGTGPLLTSRVVNND
jgi:hypothetical protein